MGLFSSKKVTTVGTTVSRMIADDQLPDAIQTGVLKSIFAEDGGDIPAYIMEELVGSIGLRAEQMYAYAKKNYTHGLPSGQYLSATKGRNEVAAVLTALEGSPVMVDYCRYGPPNNLHVGWLKLVADHGYDPVTNQLGTLSTQKGTEVYLIDAVVVVPAAGLEDNQPGSLDQWGPAASSGLLPGRTLGSLRKHSPVRVDPNATSEYLQVTYTWKSTNVFQQTEWSGGFFNVPTDGYDDEADYFQVRYAVGDAIKYWMYQVGSGTYPTLDAVFAEPDEIAGTFFPFAYFRFNKTSEVDNTTTEAYKTTKKMLKYLGVDYAMVGEAVNENPDIADVEQAMLVMAVPASTTNPIEQRYLFDFFDTLYGASEEKFSSQTQVSVKKWFFGDNDIDKSSIIIQDKRFKMALSNEGLFKQRRSGSVGSVGSYQSGIFYENVVQTYETEFGSQQVIVAMPTHYYRRQVAPGLYDEIQVRNLQMKYFVYDNYTVTADETDNILLIPLDMSIVEDYSFPDRERLYTRALHYVFNSRVVTKLRWYQSDFFQFLMIAVAVVVTVWSMGTTMAPMLAALAAGTTTLSAVAWALVVKLLTGLIIAAALKLFVKAVGVEFAFLLAIVAVAYGGMHALNAGSIQGAPWAGELLSLATGLGQAISESIGELIGDLAKEASEFTKFMEEQFKLLDTAKDLLKNTSLLQPFIIFGESPETFYNRTVHSGNIGVISIDAVSWYVDMALTLPELDETIGDNTYDQSFA